VPVHQKQSHLLKNQNNNLPVGQVKINFYTDPLDCWSYAFEKHWEELLHRYNDEIEYRYVLCGMIPDWKTYSDPMNSVSKPIQMGPVWMHASEVTHVKMKYSLWHEDPPSSSYPACIAVKTAGLQSDRAEKLFLNAVRSACMNDGLNIAKQSVLISLAENLKDDHFDPTRFKEDWSKQKGLEPFRADLQKARFHSIGRFPTLTLQNRKNEGIIIVGYRPFEVLEQAFLKIRGK
jgi:putative protein-disulfide isomerase